MITDQVTEPIGEDPRGETEKNGIEDLGLAVELTANARGQAAEGNRGRT